MKRDMVAICLVSVLLLATIPLGMPSTVNATNVTRNALFLDKIVLDSIYGEEAIQALLDDEIQAIDDTIQWQYLDELSEAESIRIAEIPRNGYGYLCINCQKYPLNLTAFRRAFSFAIDKERMCDETWEGHAYPQDSVVPRKSPWSIEEDLPYHYYESEISRANQILDHAGFDDIDGDSFREAPNGEVFNVTIETPDSASFAMEIGEIAEQALRTIGINAIFVPTEFYDYLNRLYFHGDYDMVFTGRTFSDFDLDWLAYEYWSEYADKPYYNFPNFQNDTYDSWRDQLLHATEYDKVYEAAREMQKILFYQCPIVPCYSNFEISAYRNDRFEGFVNDVSEGPISFWTSLQVHLREDQGGPFGGTLHRSFPLAIGSFNIFKQCCYGVEQFYTLFYDSLMRRGPDGKTVPWLAESYIVETHDDNDYISPEHVRFTFDLIQNATWTDGKPITAEDVAFSFNYYGNTVGNPFRRGLEGMIASYVEGNDKFVIEFNTTSYWHLHTIGYKPIIPKHVFKNITGTDYQHYYSVPPEEEMVTSGPYNVSALENRYVEFSRNPNYFYRYTPSNANETTSENPIASFFSPLMTGVSVACTVIFVGTGVLEIKEARDRN
ncbi:MAG: hypothetical protein GF309_06525 [Candidatus Lokiarchaeota archaeon]|nr:hypothetical protein [Candidatus Lokiarchaeota archaeon]